MHPKNISSLGPFLCNAGLKMRVKFNTVSSQLDLSCTILDWRCVPKIFSSIGPFSYNAELEMRPKFNTVSSQLDLSWRCVPKFYTVLSVGPFLCNARLKMRPKFLYCVFSVGPFLYNTGLKMRPRLCLLVKLLSQTVCDFSSVFFFPIHQSSVVVFRSSVKFRLYNSTGNCFSRSW